MIDYIMTMPTSEAILWWAGLGWMGTVLVSLSIDHGLLSVSNPGATAIFFLTSFFFGFLMGPPMLLYAIVQIAIKKIRRANFGKRSAM